MTLINYYLLQFNITQFTKLSFGGYCMNSNISCLKTTDSSPSHDRVAHSSLEFQSKQLENTEVSVQGEEKVHALTNGFTNQAKCKQRRHSFIQLESNTQIRIQNMILDEIHMQGKVKTRKMSLDNDQACIYSADVYSKDEIHWKNREITQLTTKKLDSIPIGNIKKLKVLSEQPMKGYRLFKVTMLEKEVKDYAIRNNDVSQWFSNSVWIRLVNMGFEVRMKTQLQGEMEGQIYKKSQFLGNWQKRYISISSKNGLSSSKKKDDNPSVKIKQTSQVWTRFEIIEFAKQKFIVIKIWHMMFKYQFAVPISDSVRWCRAFASLIN